MKTLTDEELDSLIKLYFGPPTEYRRDEVLSALMELLGYRRKFDIMADELNSVKERIEKLDLQIESESLTDTELGALEMYFASGTGDERLDETMQKMFKELRRRRGSR